MDYSLNILGSEWIIIVFVALIALLGTNRLPEITKKLGRAVGEYTKTKNEIQSQLSGTSANLNITNPMQNERQKLEFMAKSLGISRSELYAKALATYVSGHESAGVTERLNEIYSEQESTPDPLLEKMQFKSLPAERW